MRRTFIWYTVVGDSAQNNFIIFVDIHLTSGVIDVKNVSTVFNSITSGNWKENVVIKIFI